MMNVGKVSSLHIPARAFGGLISEHEIDRFRLCTQHGTTCSRREEQWFPQWQNRQAMNNLILLTIILVYKKWLPFEFTKMIRFLQHKFCITIPTFSERFEAWPMRQMSALLWPLWPCRWSLRRVSWWGNNNNNNNSNNSTNNIQLQLKYNWRLEFWHVLAMFTPIWRHQCNWKLVQHGPSQSFVSTVRKAALAFPEDGKLQANACEAFASFSIGKKTRYLWLANGVISQLWIRDSQVRICHHFSAWACHILVINHWILKMHFQMPFCHSTNDIHVDLWLQNTSSWFLPTAHSFQQHKQPGLCSLGSGREQPSGHRIQVTERSFRDHLTSKLSTFQLSKKLL